MEVLNLNELTAYPWRYYQNYQHEKLLMESFPCLVTLDVLAGSKLAWDDEDKTLLMASRIPPKIEELPLFKVAATLADVVFALAHQLYSNGGHCICGWLYWRHYDDGKPKGDPSFLPYNIPFMSQRIKDYFSEQRNHFKKSLSKGLLVVTVAQFLSDDKLLALLLATLLRVETSKPGLQKQKERIDLFTKILLLGEGRAFPLIADAFEERGNFPVSNALREAIPKTTKEILWEFCELGGRLRDIVKGLQMEGLLGPDYKVEAPIDVVVHRFWQLVEMADQGGIFAKCQNCGKLFTRLKRGRKAKFCSDRCRVAYKRKKDRGEI